MDYATIVALVISQGIPVAEKLWKMWASKAEPTQADWDELKELGKATAQSNMLAALTRNGIDPASGKGAELMALVK